jgi:hypothetical protein
MPTNLTEVIKAKMDEFTSDLANLIRQAALEQVSQALGVDAPKTLPMPNRRPRYLKARKTEALPKQLGQAWNKIKKSKRPVTSTMVAKTLGTNENNARQVLAKLLRKRLLTTQMLGDGTARKVYLPSKI